MKRAVIINGVATPVDKGNFLVDWLEKNGFQVQVVEPMLGQMIELVKEEPEVIVARSLGGLVVPKLAIKYPKARLVLISTGARMAPTEKTAKILFDLVRKEWGAKFLYWGLRLPKVWLTTVYKKTDPVSENDNEVEKLLVNNIEFFRELSLERIKEVIGILERTDNRELLRKLKNKTLIYSGENDGLMPANLSREMNELIKGSKLVVTKGGHGDMLGKAQLEEIGKFLGVK